MRHYFLTRAFNLCVVFACLTTIIICARELFLIPTSWQVSTEMVKIGTLLDAANTVKLKKSNLFSWNDAHSNSTLHSEDMIYTHKNSSAEINLDGDKSFKLQPETMIQLLSKDQVSLGQGEVEFNFKNRNSKLEISLAGKKYTIQSADATVVIKREENKDKILVKKGSIGISDDKNSTVKVQADEQLTVTQTAVNLSSTLIKLQFPIGERILTTNNLQEVHFKAELSEKLRPSKLLISKNKFFDELVFTDTSFNGEKTIPLPKGEYFWRVERDGTKSEMANFQILLKVESPALLGPENNSELTYYQNNPKIKFQWETSAKVNHFLLEFFDHNDNLLHSQNVKALVSFWSPQQNGIYKWRVTPIADNVVAEPSPLHQFEVKLIDISKEEPIVIELVKPNQKVDFHWKAAPGADYNLFELAEDSNFKTIRVSKKLLRDNTSITFPQVGTYYWRSTSISGHGKKIINRPERVIIKPTPPPGKPEPLPELKIKLQTFIPSPDLFSRFIASAYATEYGAVHLNWQALSDAKMYEIEIYSDQDMQNKIETIKVKHSSYQWKVPRPGTFYWRFRYQDFWDRFSPYSDASTLTIEAPPSPTSKTKKPIQKLVRKIKKSTILSRHTYLGLYTAPASFSYQYKSSNDYEIDGTAINGWIINFTYPMKGLINQFEIQAGTSTGIVFDDQDFYYRILESNIYFPTSVVELYTGAKMIEVPGYTEDSDPILGDKIQKTGLTFGVAYRWKSPQIVGKLGLIFGELSVYTFELSYDFYKMGSFIFPVKIIVEKTSLDNGDDEVISQKNQIVTGMNYLF